MSEFNSLYERIEGTLVSRFREGEAIQHFGDRGEGREDFLRTFLSDHLPRRFGVTKGEVISTSGEHSHSADIILYDAENCPVLYAGHTSILPIEGVYGIIEVKSRLSKTELDDALGKIASFRTIYKPERVEIRGLGLTRTFVPSPPFGFVFGYDLADNSLTSLHKNFKEFNRNIGAVDYLASLIVVLGQGVIHYALQNPNSEAIVPVLEGKHMIKILTQNDVTLEGVEWKRKLMALETGPLTFGRFFTYLLITLESMDLGVPNLSRYANPVLTNDSESREQEATITHRDF